LTKANFYRHLEQSVDATEGTLTEHLVLKNLEGWDSMAVVDFIAFVDEQFSMPLEYESIMAAKTGGDLAALVSSHLKPE